MALHIAARRRRSRSPRRTSRPRTASARSGSRPSRPQDRPENVRERIVSGKLDKWLDEVVLLRQKHVNEDKHGGKTIEQLRIELADETRENVVIRRFVRFAVGG